MRRILTSTLIVIGLLVSSLTAANAIFGLSACEKLKKKIMAEEEITKVLWDSRAKSFNRADKGIVTKRELILSVTSKIPVHESENKIIKLIESNTSCYSANIVAKARIEKKSNEDNIAQALAYKKWIKDNPDKAQEKTDFTVARLRNAYSDKLILLTKRLGISK